MPFMSKNDKVKESIFWNSILQNGIYLQFLIKGTLKIIFRKRIVFLSNRTVVKSSSAEIYKEKYYHFCIKLSIKLEVTMRNIIQDVNII